MTVRTTVNEVSDPTRGATRSAARGSALSFAGAVVAAAGGFVLTLVVARGLGPTRTGVFFVSLSLFVILANTLELGADTGLVRSIPRLRTLNRTSELKRTVLVAVVPVTIVGVISAILVTVSAQQLAAVFMQQGSTVLGAHFLRAIAPYLSVAPVATVVIAGTRGFGSVIPYVAIQNVGLSLVRPLVIGVLVATGAATDYAVATAWGLPWAAALAVGAVILVRQINRFRPTEGGQDTQPSYRSIGREFWGFSTARAFAGAADTMLVWLDVLLVGWLVGPHQAGIYATASRFVTTGTLALQATRVAIAPHLARLLTAGRKHETEAIYHNATRAVVAASWPLYIGLACFAPTILRLFGHGFTEGSTALTVLSLAMLVDVGTGNIGSVLLMGGGSRWNVLNSVSGLAVDVILDVALIPHFGATGAAIGWAAAIVVINTLACLEVHYVMGLRVLDMTTVRLAGGTLALVALPGLVISLAVGRSFTGLVTWLAVSGACYCAWLWRHRVDFGFDAALRALRQQPSTISGVTL
jgi:O-antigen/teichoic acid export membrane protein